MRKIARKMRLSLGYYRSRWMASKTRQKELKLNGITLDFSQLQTRFTEVLKGFSTGPRSAARLGIDFILAEQSKTATDALAKELQQERRENDKLRKELGLKRKQQDIPFRSGTGSGSAPAPKSALPINAKKSLQSAFEKHDWGLR